MAIEQYQIKSKYIRGVKNTLADAISWVVELESDMCQDPEPGCKEYGYYMFEQLHNVPTVQKLPPKDNTIPNEIDTFSAESAVHLKLNITHEGMCQLQQRDPFSKRILDQLQASKLPSGNPYYIYSELLMRNVMDNKQYFQTVDLSDPNGSSFEISS